jgi:glycosyltransferase involved in cell wall biosynthesis
LELLPYSIVIPTFERGQALTETLESIAGQPFLPAAVLVVDGSTKTTAERLVSQFQDRLPIRHLRASIASAAQQRNEGAESVTTPLLAFFDDDMIISRDACAKIVRTFSEDTAEQIGGIAARILGETHLKPKPLLRAYYRLQAGFDHETFGGRLFGPVINCYPCYDAAKPDELIPADWLNAGCVFYRTPIFLRERFPQFEGYSFMEDVHLSARIAKTHRLYFHAGAFCEHRCGTNSLKSDPGIIARMRLRNQRLVAKEVLGLSGPLFESKLLLHRLFASISIVRRRHGPWWRELAGTWLP